MTMGAGRPSGKSCPICAHYLTNTPEDGEYIRCPQCGVLRTRFNYNSKLYSSAYAHNYMEYAQTDVNTPLNLFRLGLISRWLKERDVVLDVGCCVGEFIRFAEHYYHCAGFEPNTVAARAACTRATSPIFTELNGQVPRAKCITMFDVLEHLEDPRRFIRNLSERYLLSDGIMVVTTPNVEVIPVWGDEVLRKWKHYKPKEHLFLYTERSLEILFTEAGFSVIHVGHEESDIRPGNSNGDIVTFVGRKNG